MSSLNRGARPWLVVTEDGRRPWHKKFVVRQTDAGPIAYWWGQFVDVGNPMLRREAYARVQRVYKRRRRVYKRRYMFTKHISRLAVMVGGAPWRELDYRAAPHPGPCNMHDYVGIAYLPPAPDCWRPDAIWPNWRHLAHGEEECARAWATLEEASDEQLQALLRGIPLYLLGEWSSWWGSLQHEGDR